METFQTLPSNVLWLTNSSHRWFYWTDYFASSCHLLVLSRHSVLLSRLLTQYLLFFKFASSSPAWVNSKSMLGHVSCWLDILIFQYHRWLWYSLYSIFLCSPNIFAFLSQSSSNYLKICSKSLDVFFASLISLYRSNLYDLSLVDISLFSLVELGNDMDNYYSH
jgi:hypothetical protein